ncbi:MAG: TrfA family protein [Proteobacteria bacterium]|nr:TrfA family protein [Desulfocapsa sp.]MBU3945474.1 TrfA family protein [Pseudomonadota bacterium]MDO8947384.1 plasmid replication initiator TrfA [Desulfocapsaceae bacterium]MBU4029185.1 TrfA family protein [Pseudomonadota bacterium]MBU4043914.1 TrfA family protein [Pseudomonadota bacterium]
MTIYLERNSVTSKCEEEIVTLSTSVNKQIDDIQRKAYLNSKGINPNDQFKLDKIFPESIGKRSDLRHIPNDYARSSLFTATNKNQPRKTLMRKKLFHYNEFVSILYTGIELRAEDDEIVWMQILKYGQGLPLGESFEFSVKDLVRDVGWAKNGHNYDRVRDCISRLRANDVLALNSKAYGKSGSICLIGNYEAVNDEEGKPTIYRTWLDPNLIVLFAGKSFTSHTWEIYRKLSPVARRLANYIESHKHPYPLNLETFQQMCGSQESSTTGWRRTVKKACAELQEVNIAETAMLTKDDKICCVRHKDRDV